MKRIEQKQLTQGILWSAAIIAAAMMGAPQYFTSILLPALGYTPLVNLRPSGGCPRN